MAGSRFTTARVLDGQPRHSVRIVYELYDDPRIGKNELLVLMAILRFANWTTREDQVSLAQIMGREKVKKGETPRPASRLGNEKTVRAAIRELVAIGVLAVEPIPGESPLYRVIVPPPAGSRPNPSQETAGGTSVSSMDSFRSAGGDSPPKSPGLLKRDVETTEEKTKTSSLPSNGPLGPRPSNGSETGPERPAAPAPKPEAHGLRLVKSWVDSFKAHFGTKNCVILWGRDVALMNKVIAAYGVETTEKMLHAFWKYRVKSGKPVTIPTFYGVADRVYFDVKDGGTAGARS